MRYSIAESNGRNSKTLHVVETGALLEHPELEGLLLRLRARLTEN